MARASDPTTYASSRYDVGSGATRDAGNNDKREWRANGYGCHDPSRRCGYNHEQHAGKPDGMGLQTEGKIRQPIRKRSRKKTLSRKKRKMNLNMNRQLIVFHCNIRGFNSKKESLINVVNNVKPDIITLNETGIRNRNKVIIPGYISFCKNRKLRAMGGVSTSVKDDLKSYTVSVKEGIDDDEYIITRLEHCHPALSIVNVYGEQEGRTSREDLISRWNRLRMDIEAIKSRGDMCLIIGDMNKLIGSDKFGVYGNHDKVSAGGRLVRELLASDEFVLVNNTDLALGGPFTWEDPSGSERKSCLDLVICCRTLLPFIKSLVIDSERKHAVQRVMWRDGKWKTILLDHFPLLLVLDNLPISRSDNNKTSIWNFGKEGGWENYRKLTDEKSQRIDEIVGDTSKDIDEIDKELDTILTKIMFKSFGKVTKKCDRNIVDKKKKDDINDAMELVKKREAALEKEIDKLRKCRQGRVGKVFKIREAVQGSKKNSMDAQAIKDPVTGSLVVSIPRGFIDPYICVLRKWLIPTVRSHILTYDSEC